MTVTFPKLRTFDFGSMLIAWTVFPDNSSIPNSLRGLSADLLIVDDPHGPDALDEQTEALARDHDDHFWPHKKGCPVCGSDAYVGFVVVECCNTRCQNFVWREGM